ncbi:hypothetical protein ILYODFUR_037845 [Ilyodon furcidens]|uniref:Uncharacterized protein n=1 Tax=Ilyodon furcidens TaxID=33524 RepID=A0ABV0U5C8_9TELE
MRFYCNANKCFQLISLSMMGLHSCSVVSTVALQQEGLGCETFKTPTMYVLPIHAVENTVFQSISMTVGVFIRDKTHLVKQDFVLMVKEEITSVPKHASEYCLTIGIMFE